MKILAWLLVSVVLLTARAPAQQANAQLNTDQLPPGISVVGTGKVRVSSWLQTMTFTARTLQAARTFEASVRQAGVPAESISLAPLGAGLFKSGTPGAAVIVTFDPGLTDRLRSLARVAGVTVEQNSELVPADEDDLYRRALGLAVADARQQAEAVAAADHQHVGKLINFAPSPIDLARKLAPESLPSILMGVSNNLGYVSASVIVTFAIVP